MDTSNLVIALHSLSKHPPGPLPILGGNGRPVTHARYDEGARTHIARIPYDDWASGVGRDIIKYNADPSSQWLPLIESTDDNQTLDTNSSMQIPEGQVTAFTENIPSKLPGEAVAGRGEVPADADRSHMPEEPLTPDEQHNAPDDHRVQLTQPIVEAEAEDEPRTDKPEIPEAEKQLTPGEQREAKDDPRVCATETVIEPTPDAPGTGEVSIEGEVLTGGDLSGASESKKDSATKAEHDQPADDLDAITNFRSLRKVALDEGCDAAEVNKIDKAEDMRALIRLHRESKAAVSDTPSE